MYSEDKPRIGDYLSHPLIFMPLFSLIVVAGLVLHETAPKAIRFIESHLAAQRFADENRMEWSDEKLQLISRLANAVERQKNWCESGFDTVYNFYRVAEWHNREVDRYARVVMRSMHGSQYRGVELTLPQRVAEFCKPPRRQLR